MVEDKEKKVETESVKMEQVLRERHRLEQLIEDKFRKKRTILFSDVCGYTKYMETWGDIAGRGWIQKHHDIVFPAIKENDGEIIDVMGDGIMASFPFTLSAVKASIAVQEGLRQYNAGTDKAHQIHVKIGINTGEVLVDGEHVAGDVVNVASRIQNQAGPDQVLVDKSVFEEVCGSEDVICRFHAVVPVKGKADPLELYRIAWQDEDIILSAEPRVRAEEPEGEKKPRPKLKVLQLEISQEEDHLKISATEANAGEVNTIRHYEEMPIPKERIGKLCREIVETLNNVNRRGRLTREVLIKLREVGQLFCDELFTPEVKEKVRKAEADHLILQLDDQLVHIPWELIHDGQQFLCQKFNMGRLVKTRQPVLRARTRSLGRPFKMLVLVDPRGDLEGAYREGTELRDFMDRFKDYVSVSSRSSDITADFIRQKIRNFDLIHFAGHAEYHPESPADSGWRLSDGVFSARDITKLSGTAAMPALVFSNACQSARTEQWRIKEEFQDEIFGLANAFILSGVKHYIGTFWEILDEPSSRFALECYKHALSGMTVGEAVRQARLSLIKDYGEETIVWASYLLYGDPTFNYTDQVMASEAAAEPVQPEKAASLEGVVRTREQVIDFAEKKESKKRRHWWAAAGAVVLLVIVSLWIYPGFLSKGIGEFEREALASFEAGDYSKAIATCETIREKNPKRALGYLILGNIHFLKGDHENASALFRKALDAEEGAPPEKAEGLLGLGRIASIGKKTDEALRYYQQAALLDPKSAQPYVSQGIVLDSQGRFTDAIKVLTTAQALAPNDPALRAFGGQVREKSAIAENKEKREKIDRQVQELLESFKNPSPQAASEDGWTSFPLTLWVMDFSSTGHCLREGEERLIACGITERAIEKSRVKIVERSLLDKLLEELKLGTSRLADQATALSIGKIMAARVILSGQVIYDGMQTQVAVRLIETETGEIRGALNEPFVSTASTSEITQKLSDILLAKLKALYPLRGRILEVGEKRATLNIGRKHGVQVAQQFRVPGTNWIIEVEDADQERSIAKLKGGPGTITPGLRVEILSDGGK